MGSLQDDGMYVKGKQERGRTQDKGSSGRKKSKSREHKKTMEATMWMRLTLKGEIVRVQV